MFIEPGVEVNSVIDAATAEPNERHIQLRQQGDPDAQIDGRLLLGEATHSGQRQVGRIHHNPCLAR